ncbi:MAG: hypothetical protein EOL95_09480 [Bacteroidia bacterium]|nr:hypothetical protein [Bacteroidia bacterium]
MKEKSLNIGIANEDNGEIKYSFKIVINRDIALRCLENNTKVANYILYGNDKVDKEKLKGKNEKEIAKYMVENKLLSETIEMQDNIQEFIKSAFEEMYNAGNNSFSNTDKKEILNSMNENIDYDDEFFKKIYDFFMSGLRKGEETHKPKFKVIMN